MNIIIPFFNWVKISKIFFLLACFIILCTPVLKIDQSSVSSKENRKLSSYKNIYNFQNKSFNFNYGVDFENYIKDRFFGRYLLIHVNSFLKYHLSYRYVFYKATTIDKAKKIMYSNLLPGFISNERQKEIKNQLKLFATYCKQNNIKFYTVVIPPKETILIPDIVKNNVNTEAYRRVKNINAEEEFDFFYLFDEFMENKNNTEFPLYYKTDSHLTLDGTFLAYNILMQKIKKDFPNVNILDSTDFNTNQNNKVIAEMDRTFTLGKDCDLAYLSDELCLTFLDTNYRYYTYKNYKKIERIRENSDYYRRKIFHYPNGYNLKILIFGDSSSENLMDILPYSFKHTEQIRLNGPRKITDRQEKFKIFKYYKKEIETFMPDIIVIYIGYGSLGYLKDIAKEI